MHLPKVKADGEPVAVSGEAELALSYKLGKAEMKVRFQPDRMTRAGAAELRAAFYIAPAVSAHLISCRPE
jgi:hypothetical protein